MKKIFYLLNRIGRGNKCTFGEFSKANYATLIGYTLEDEDRGLKQTMTKAETLKIKVKGETAIGTGLYRLVVRMSPSKKQLRVYVENVTGFDGVQVHSGNTISDTLGCPLLGAKQDFKNNRVYECKAVNDQLLKEIQANEKIGIESYLIIL